MRAVGIDTRSAGRALERGRVSYAKHAWRQAYESLSRADTTRPLEPEDSRAARDVDREEGDCVERGYLLLGSMLESFAAGDFEAARAKAADAVAIGERFGDHDLVALGVMDLGHALLELGRAREGPRLVDESMVAVTSGSSRRSWPASSTATRSRSVRACTSCAVRGSGPPPSRSGASVSPTWWTTALRLPRSPGRDHAAAGRLAGGPRGSRARRGPGHAEPTGLRLGAVRPGRPASPAGRLRSSRADVSRRSPAGRAAAAPGWHCSGWRRAASARPLPRSAGLSLSPAGR